MSWKWPCCSLPAALSPPLHKEGGRGRQLPCLIVLCTGWLCYGVPYRAASGAEPSETAKPAFSEAERNHWAFQPVIRPSVPQVLHADRVRTPVDAFLLRRLEQHKLTFSAPARKEVLLRRAKFDLLGLPPTPEEIEQFLADDSPDAYERVIERFLASPHYGETWGRLWLDLVRFAETAGFNADPIRPLAYKYRDYVIRSINDDTPYNRFVQEQLAGDELFPEDPDAWIASGYNRMWPDESNASDVELARQDALNDLTANVGSVFLGLSVGCAQCHNHKFDPILQRDFYELQAYFSGIVLRDRVPVGTNQELARYDAKLKAWRQRTEAVRSKLHHIEQQAAAKAGRIKRLKFPAVVLEAIDTAPENRTAFQHQLVFWSERQIEYTEKDLLKQMSEEDQQRRKQLTEQLKQLEQTKPQPPNTVAAMAVGEVESGPAVTHLLAGGSYQRPGEELKPQVLSVLEPITPRSPTAPAQPNIVSPRPDTSGRRSALARWLTDPKQPLTGRVMVNRIWQQHFGKGLVENANDFGTQTPPPSHPELLDWLASEFVDRGWSIKDMHRLIMTSAAYRQSTAQSPRAATRGTSAVSRSSDLATSGSNGSLTDSDGDLRSSFGGVGRPAPNAGGTEPQSPDPDNTLYWHFPRQRLKAESIRDAMLFVSGKLNSKMYGPGVKPELPPNYSQREGWKPSEDVAERRRRSVYIFAKRNLRYPLLQVFDFPDMHESCARRPETTVAPQALMLLNSELILDSARAFAERLIDENAQPDIPEFVRRAYVLAFGRQPGDSETEEALTFIRQQQALIEDRLQSGEKVLLPRNLPKFQNPALAAALVDFCHVLLNANEFIYTD